MLVATDTLASPLLRTISKALADDPAGGLELVRLSLYEMLADLADYYGPGIRRDISKSAADSRALLVREYVTKRAAGEDVAGLLDGAQALGRISKDEDPETRHAASAKQPREHGRWASASGAEKVDLVRTHASGVLNALGGDSQQPLDSKSGYQQLAATGRALKYVSALSANQAGMAVGAVAQLAGEIGPQAENVLGPSVKRTAYRYRGTEKKPSASIQQQAHLLGSIAQQLGDGKALSDLTPDEQRQVGEWVRSAGAPARKPGAPAPASDAAAAVFASVMNDKSRGEKSGDELRMEATSQYLAATLQSRIPSLHHAKISLEAGKMPPSIGYLIDADGDVVSEAQGYNGDHYLPFDLKNLSDLHGGAYVRTRTTGGPTDEDIYTGLMMGARQVTVVSHSGVFTLAFDKDVRGGRRYSDKARQMVERYAALLEQIGSGNHMEIPFDQDTEQQLRAQAIAAAPRNPTKQVEELGRLKRDKLNELAFRDDDELREQAAHNVVAQYQQGDMAGVSRQTMQRDGEDEFHELSRSRDEAQARAYRLDGKGYEAALVALQQEFPFYLQTPQYETWRQFLSARSLPPQAVRGKAGQLGGPRTADVGFTRRRALVPKKIERQAAGEPAKEQKPEPSSSDESAATPAAAAAPATAVSDTEIKASGLADDVAGTVGEATFLVSALDNADSVVARDDQEALNEGSPSAYLGYVANTYTSPRAVAQWLLAPTTDPGQVKKLQTSLKYLQGRLDLDSNFKQSYPPEFWAQAQSDLADIEMLKAPYAKAAGGDPVLKVADKPQLFPGVPTEHANLSSFTAYLAQNPDLAPVVADYADKSDQDIAKDIAAEVRNYQQLLSVGEQIKANDGIVDGLAIPSYVDPVDAVDVEQQGRSHGLYEDIANKQKAWSVLRGMRIVEILTGVTPPVLGGGGAAPKAPTAPSQEFKSPFAKRQRSRVVVHPLGSPMSVRLAKRMASR